MTLMALVVAVTAGAQVEPVGDLNNDGLVGVEDLMELLSVFGSNYNELNTHPDCVPIEWDGYTYDVVQVGSTCWFAENLRTTIDCDGQEIPYVGSMEAWADMDMFDKVQTIYQFNDSLLSIHGRLYTWAAANTACPSGWNQGADENSWYVLEDAAGMPVTNIGRVYNRGVGSEVGSNLLSESAGGTNLLGFNALPSGWIQHAPWDGTTNFYGLDNWVGFWTTRAGWDLCEFGGIFGVDNYMGGGVARKLYHQDSEFGNDGISRESTTGKFGLSVRCMKHLSY